MMENKTLNDPMVSVVMPAYNAERYIEEAIRSVQSQTIQDFELIVINDCSKDSTESIVRRLQKEDFRIHLISNTINLGVAQSRNKGFETSKGKYVALLDSDDLWYPEKLKKQIDILESTNADLVFCSYGIINEDGKKCCNDFIVPKCATLKIMLAKSVISCSTAIMRQEITDKYHFSNEYYHEDYVYWIKLLQDGIVAKGTEEVLAEYRQVAKSRASNKISSARNRYLVYRDYLKFPYIKCIWYLMQYFFAGMKKYFRSNVK